MIDQIPMMQVKGWKGWLHYRPEPSAGRHIYELNDSQGEPLDMDVIDNTWLDANVQVSRATPIISRSTRGLPCRRHAALPSTVIGAALALLAIASCGTVA